MGRLKLHSMINTIQEESTDCEHMSNRGALACMVNSEVGAVLAVMRRSVQWGGHYMDGDNQLEHSLIQSFKALRKQIFLCEHQWLEVDPSLFLQPFLDVIRLDETGAPITGVALSSLYKILTFGILDLNSVNIESAMHSVVDAVTSCRFEVTDPVSEEVVLMKILQVLLACMKSKASIVLDNQHVCSIVNTCFRVVHQAGTKGELLQRIARHTMHELVRCIFSRLPDIDQTKQPMVNVGGPCTGTKMSGTEKVCAFEVKQSDNYKGSIEYDAPLESFGFASNASKDAGLVAGFVDESAIRDGINSDQAKTVLLMTEPYGVPCMVEIFEFLCSMLNDVEQTGIGPRSNPLAFDEDVPLFALGLINSAIELGGPSTCRHPKLLSLIQDELFHNLMHFGLSMSPLILSMVCSIVLNLYHHLRTELKLQLEVFFSCVILRLAEIRHGVSYHQQEVAMEALVDFCRQNTFMAEMYANLDCDLTCHNVFEDLVNLLSKSAFPVNCPLSTMHVLALDGLIAVIQGMADRIVNACPILDDALVGLEEYTPFWIAKCDDYTDPSHWVGFVRQRKYIKRTLMIGVDHFNRDPKKGLEYLQGVHLLPEKLDPHSVACFFRYTAGLDKNLVGDFLGNHDEFCVRVLHEFSGMFDFQDMNLDTALRLFLETFRLPGESQKIQRVLEAFSERYYEQSPQILVNKDAALVLSYSLILLNTDQHNVQVKRKMTEEDFIRNNRHINGGDDLPREYLSKLYNSICKNEIRTIPEQGVAFLELTPSRWIDLMCKSKKTAPFIICDSGTFLDRDMFIIMSGPTIAALSVVFDHAEHEDVFQTCVDGFLSMAKISAHHHLEDVLDDLVVSLCKFTTLMNPSLSDEPVLAFAYDAKARMASVTVFTIANRFGDYIRTGWLNILECILRLHRLGLLSTQVASNAVDDLEPSSINVNWKPITSSLSASPLPVYSTPWRSSGFMSRFTQLLSLDTEEPISQPTEEQLAAHQCTLQTIQVCHIDDIFTESKFLHADSLLQLARALVWAPGQPQKMNTPLEDEETAVFCLELLIAVTLNNRDRITLLWQHVYEHIADIIQSTIMPCALVEKAVFGLLHICQRLLPYKENLADELLRSLQLVLKLDARVADTYCEHITQEIMHLVKANATHIRSHMGWRTIASLLSITARHPEASDVGFEALTFIMSEGVHLSPINYILCLDASRQFAESCVDSIERSVRALDLMAESVTCLSQWKELVDDASKFSSKEVEEMWLRLLQGLKKVCLDKREEVRNHALSSLQRCMTAGAEGICVSPGSWLQCFDLVIFPMLDDFLEIVHGGHTAKDYRNMEGTLVHALKLMSKVFLQLLPELSLLPGFCKLWLEILECMEKYMKAKVRGKKCEKLQELIPELLTNMLLVMKSRGNLVRTSAIGGDRLWELTWLHVNEIDPSLQSEIFPVQEQKVAKKENEEGSLLLPTVVEG